MAHGGGQRSPPKDRGGSKDGGRGGVKGGGSKGGGSKGLDGGGSTIDDGISGRISNSPGRIRGASKLHDAMSSQVRLRGDDEDVSMHLATQNFVEVNSNADLVKELWGDVVDCNSLSHMEIDHGETNFSRSNDHGVVLAIGAKNSNNSVLASRDDSIVGHVKVLNNSSLLVDKIQQVNGHSCSSCPSMNHGASSNVCHDVCEGDGVAQVQISAMDAGFLNSMEKAAVTNPRREMAVSFSAFNGGVTAGERGASICQNLFRNGRIHIHEFSNSNSVTAKRMAENGFSQNRNFDLNGADSF